ncbi:methyl-accepting chemotaxis protein [Bermanella marisrubri]|uniref:Probable chemotaxis transducer n=1 Tax=Bermanella marisrubri TaxID=207949 RepID=Q1N6H7_9GAMM|nr:methyl-accepting chemotaxis protein [Bermanella marisrubri]EAT13615.1 probable chemotaxis transducer [Oceanobacter sp. RED65] [Bermanella marisrubri]QIZ84402.1 methyl-accepting chemotaxis protein [Bermanella marisrubri]
MKWADLGLRKKLIVPIAVLGALLLAVSSLLMLTTEKLVSDFSSINENYIPAIELVLNADRDLYQAQIAERSMAMGASIEQFRGTHKENLDQVANRIAQISRMEVNQESRGLANEFLQEFGEWRPKSEGLVTDLSEGTITQAQAKKASLTYLDQEFEGIRDTLDKLGDKLGKKASSLQRKSLETKSIVMFKAAMLVLLALAVTVAIAVFFPRIIVRPLIRVTSVLDELASGKGDLTKRLPVTGKDEVGSMATSFNHFMGGLNGLIKQTQNVSQEVEHAGQDLASGVASVKDVSDQYVHSMDMVSTANQEMGAAIQEVSSNSQQVSSDAKEADALIKQVATEYQRAMQEIRNLAKGVQDSADIIQELEKQTTNIESMLGVIQGIAEQTNLLALNAAIEAARAGEQGRGFAVVADEVRSLAGRTQETTSDINDIIEKLRNGVERAVESMEQGGQTADRTVEQSLKSRDDIENVSQVLISMTDRILQIASAIEEQTSVIDEINGNLSQAKELSESGRQGTSIIGSAVDGLNKQAKILRDRTGSFKVD